MFAKIVRGPQGKQRSLTAFVALALAVAGCGGSSREGSVAADLSPFRELARSSDCADIHNRLFLIDGVLVLWDRKGNCPDASYLVQLNGETVDEILCELHDSIAGPVKECRDEQYEEMFETIVENLDKPDLGLGSGHTVAPVQF